MVNWNRASALITGGCGHIGSRIAELLVERRTNLIRIIDTMDAYEFDQLSVYCGSFKDLDNVEIIRGDITRYEDIREAVKGIDYVFHQAAYADVAACIRDPDRNLRVNIIGTYNVLKASLEEGVKKYVFASSAAVYGDQPSINNVPPVFSEDLKPNPLSTYANAKLWGENEAKLFNDLYGLPTVSLRYFSIYGPYQIPKRNSHSWVVAIFAMRAYKGKPLEVYGGGRQVRDFIYVYDVAEANIVAAERSIRGEVINIGTGKPTRIIDLAYKIRGLSKEYFGFEPEIIIKPRPKGDPLGGYADIRKMKNMLKWEPRIGLDEGLRKYFEWLLKHKELVPEYL